MLRKQVFFMSLLLTTFLFSPSLIIAAPSYPWNIPTRVRIVQPPPVDNQRTFASVREAIVSINAQPPADQPSADNHYVIKVMPGTYADNVSFVLPQYVDLIGSGKYTTIISTSAAGAIILAGNNQVEKLKITSSATSDPFIIVNSETSSSFNDISIEPSPSCAAIPLQVGNNSEFKIYNSNFIYKTSAGSNVNSIIALGEGSKLSLVNTEIDAELNASDWGSVISLGANDVYIRGSKIRIKNNNGSILTDGTNKIEIINSEIQLVSEHRIWGIGMNGGNTSCIISNSKFDVITTYDDMGIDDNVIINSYNTNLKIDNSVLTSTTNGHYGPAILVMRGLAEINNSNIFGSISVSDTPTLKIGSSKISGGINYSTWYEGGIYLYYNCYNENYTSCNIPPTP